MAAVDRQHSFENEFCQKRIRPPKGVELTSLFPEVKNVEEERYFMIILSRTLMELISSVCPSTAIKQRLSLNTTVLYLNDGCSIGGRRARV